VILKCTIPALWFHLSPTDAVFKILKESAFLWYTFSLGKFFFLRCDVFCVPGAEGLSAAGQHKLLGLLKDVDLLEGPTCKCQH